MSEYVDCRECNTECARADGNYGYTFCSGFTPKKKPMTNADRIRAMSDEELAKWLYNFFWNGKKYIHLSSMLYWLQQPAEDEHAR